MGVWSTEPIVRVSGPNDVSARGVGVMLMCVHVDRSVSEPGHLSEESRPDQLSDDVPSLDGDAGVDVDAQLGAKPMARPSRPGSA